MLPLAAVGTRGDQGTLKRTDKDREARRALPSAFWISGAIVVAVCAAYAPVFSAGFIWDDDLHLVHNVILQPDGLYRVWILREGLNWWPVAFTSYWLEFQLWGLAPAGYHGVNVAIHAACALLLWRILLRLGTKGSAALLASALFALHPLNVETVAWVAQRKGLLSMLFFLTSVHGYLRFEDGRKARAGGAVWAWYAWSLASLALGMLAKGAIAPLPVVLLLAVAWRRRLTGEDALRIAPFVALALLLALSEIWGQQQSAGAETVRDDSLAARLAAAGWISWFYASKTLVPWNLAFSYPRWNVDPTLLFHWIPTLGALALFAVPVWLWRRGGARAGDARAVVYALSYYALMIFPALGFANFYYLRYSYVADHYQYFAQIGILALVAGGLARATRGRPLAFVTIGAACLSLLGVLTFAQSRIYHDEETVWRDTIEKNPESSLAFNNLGRIVASRGDLTAAMGFFLRATEADPSNREGWRNAGVAADLLGQRERAVDYLRMAVRHWPGAGASEADLAALDLASAHRWLARLAANSYQAPVAEFHLQRAAELESEAALPGPRAGAPVPTRSSAGDVR
jgi:tetratricopeptide (TPR) repeat protein